MQSTAALSSLFERRQHNFLSRLGKDRGDMLYKAAPKYSQKLIALVNISVADSPGNVLSILSKKVIWCELHAHKRTSVSAPHC